MVLGCLVPIVDMNLLVVFCHIYGFTDIQLFFILNSEYFSLMLIIANINPVIKPLLHSSPPPTRDSSAAAYHLRWTTC